MNFKLLSLLLLTITQLTFAAEADWEVLNLAIDNINAANPSVLANSVLNILSGFLPANQPIPTTATLPTVTTRPNTQPPIILNIDPTPAPQRPAPQPAPVNPSSSISQLFLYYPELYKQLIQSMVPATPIVAPAPVPAHQPQHVQNPSVTQIFTPTQGCNCDCKKKQKSIAEFMVNVPCPTTTEKPAKKIVVKVPCPTYATTEKPCSCQCCSCNSAPSKPEKQHKKAKNHYIENVHHSESEESREIKTVFKAYEVPRKSNSVRNYFKYAEDCSSEESH